MYKYYKKELDYITSQSNSKGNIDKDRKIYRKKYMYNFPQNKPESIFTPKKPLYILVQNLHHFFLLQKL